MDKTTYSPTVILRCNRCSAKTHHVLVSFSNNPLLAMSMVYECQDCGGTKKVFDLNPLPQVAWEPSVDIGVGDKEEKEPQMPVERGPQIERSNG